MFERQQPFRRGNPSAPRERAYEVLLHLARGNALLADDALALLEAGASLVQIDEALVVSHGVETLTVRGQEFTYVNSGETYRQTLVQDDRGDLFLTSWGDVVEAIEVELPIPGRLPKYWLPPKTHRPSRAKSPL